MSFSKCHNNIQKNIEYIFYLNYTDCNRDRNHNPDSKHTLPMMYHSSSFLNNIYKSILNHLNYRHHIYQWGRNSISSDNVLLNLIVYMFYRPLIILLAQYNYRSWVILEYIFHYQHYLYRMNHYI
jgi:hypothetical protein